MNNGGSDRGIYERRITGELAPGWLTTAEERAAKEAAVIQQEQQLRITKGKTGVTEAAQEAAASAARIKAQKQPKALETHNRFSKVFEMFIAAGLRGRAAGVRGNAPFHPGWFGRKVELSITSDEDDVYRGVDLIVRIATAEGEIRIGLDVTYSALKLDHKFGGILNDIDAGHATMLSTGHGVLKVVVGVSRHPMENSIRTWGTNQNEAYDVADVGARIREQVLFQLGKFEEYARAKGTPEHTKLADQYRAALQALTSEKFVKAKDAPGLADDALHKELFKKTEQTVAGTLPKADSRHQ